MPLTDGEPPAPALPGLEIRVRGIVQGVGFRPMVWRAAQQHGLRGDVHNDTEGVLIRVWGPAATLQSFAQTLRAQAPGPAQVDALHMRPLEQPAPAAAGFRILPSRARARAATFVPADAAPCPDCLAELRASEGRRAAYPFLACTRCGPRLSIARALPFDRANTSMAAFALCPECQAEYDDPVDRRFHAQTTACARCGPRLRLEPGSDTSRTDGAAEGPQALQQALALLRTGNIVAVKGVGCFHLAVDAGNPDALARLRARKHRPDKPLALLARDLDMVRRYRDVDAAEAAALGSRAAPIVLLDRPGALALPPLIAPGSQTLGFMLPPSPLHQLLADGFDAPLVLTSGNVSGQPPCVSNEQAREQLAALCDALLLHDRDIAHRVDDSVLHIAGGVPRMLRRGRGHAGEPVPLSSEFTAAPAVLALGAQLKNTFCLLREAKALLSPHIGDLDDAGHRRDFRRSLDDYRALFGFEPTVLAADLHPDDAATRAARELAAITGATLVTVQHHHAHVGACLAENAWPLHAGPVLGIVLDGLGWGADGSAWGGELLLADYLHSTRLARLRPAALPGIDQAMRQPWRNLAAQLFALPDGEQLLARHAALPGLRALAGQPLTSVRAMIASGVSAPPASSCGRLFDAVAAALGVAPSVQTFEAQAASALEQLARSARERRQRYDFALVPREEPAEPAWELDPAPMWRALLHDAAQGAPAPEIAWAFHAGLAAAWVRCALAAAARHDCRHVALSGGVMHNRVLFELLRQGLRAGGLHVLEHARVPAGDGGIALGQAAVAAARSLAASH